MIIILNFRQNLEHMLLQVGVLTIPFNIFKNCKINSNTDDECLYQKMPYIWKYIWNSQFTISSTTAVTVRPTPLLTTRVKFFVSMQVALSMVNVVVATDNWVFNSSVLLYQDTSDSGLLEIFRVIVTFSLSFTI